MVVSHKYKPCKICQKYFSPNDLAHHEKSCRKCDIYQCKLCKRHCPERLLGTHMASFHPDKIMNWYSMDINQRAYYVDKIAYQNNSQHHIRKNPIETVYSSSQEPAHKNSRVKANKSDHDSLILPKAKKTKLKVALSDILNDEVTADKDLTVLKNAFSEKSTVSI